MVDATVRYGKDTWAASGKPAANHNAASRLRLVSGSSYAFVFLKSPVPHGMTVVSAKLQVFAAKTSDWTGTKTLTARRISDSWKAGKLTWNNMPGVTGSSPTVAVSNATGGQLLEIDVTPHLQTVANGASHYGWRITTDSTTAHRIYGFDSPYPPRLVVSYSDKPSAPTDLVPQGGSVSVAKPYLSFSATDLSKPGEIAYIQVQIDPAASTTAPGFDSGWVQTSAPELDLSGTTYAGLASAASTQWRARVQGTDGTQSDWSPWVSFSRTDKGTLTITNPAASPNNYVAESTPPILATSSVGLDSAEVQIVDAADHMSVLAESGPLDMAGGTSISWTIPAGVIHDGQAYTTIVRATDTVDRVATAGDPTYVEASRDFTFSEDATVSAPGSLTAVPAASGLGVTLTWSRATAPDSWTVLRDGKNIASDVDPADTITSGSSHTWLDPTPKPGRLHSYEVRAVVNGKASPKSNTATATPVVEGVWILDPSRGLSFSLGGDAIDNWAQTDQAATYQVVGGSKVVIKTGRNGIEGSFSGVMESYGGRTLDDYRDHLEQIRARDDQPVHLFAANLALRVILLNLSDTPHPETMNDDPRDLVSFSFIEV